MSKMFNQPNYNLISNYADSRLKACNNCEVGSKFDNAVKQSVTFDKDSYRNNNNRLNSTISDMIYNNSEVIPDMNSRDYNSFDRSVGNYYKNEDMFTQPPYVHPYMTDTRRISNNLNNYCDKQEIKKNDDGEVKKDKKKKKNKCNYTPLYITIIVSIAVVLIMAFSFWFFITSKKIDMLGRKMLRGTDFNNLNYNATFNKREGEEEYLL